MRNFAKLVFLTLLFPSLCGCQIYDNSFSNDSISAENDSKSSLKSTPSSLDDLEKCLPVFYYDVIDPYSDIEFDYKKPIEAVVHIKPYDSGYVFEGETVYQAVTMLDNVSMQHVVDYTDHSIFENEQYVGDLLNGIQILVKYRDPLGVKDYIFVCFRVSEDGRFGFLTANQTVLFYSDAGATSYETMATKIKELHKSS